MKKLHVPFVLSLVLLAACSTTKSPKANHSDAERAPETVMVTYHVKPGKEFEMEGVLERAWKVYRAEKLVFPEPHIIVQDKENGDKPRMVEIFTWVSHSAPAHAPDSVKNIWNEMQALCEARDGHAGLGGGEVEIIEPKKW